MITADNGTYLIIDGVLHKRKRKCGRIVKVSTAHKHGKAKQLSHYCVLMEYGALIDIRHDIGVVINHNVRRLLDNDMYLVDNHIRSIAHTYPLYRSVDDVFNHCDDNSATSERENDRRYYIQNGKIYDIFDNRLTNIAQKDIDFNYSCYNIANYWVLPETYQLQNNAPKHKAIIATYALRRAQIPRGVILLIFSYIK